MFGNVGEWNKSAMPTNQSILSPLGFQGHGRIGCQIFVNELLSAITVMFTLYRMFTVYAVSKTIKNSSPMMLSSKSSALSLLLTFEEAIL